MFTERFKKYLSDVVNLWKCHICNVNNFRRTSIFSLSRLQQTLGRLLLFFIGKNVSLSDQTISCSHGNGNEWLVWNVIRKTGPPPLPPLTHRWHKMLRELFSSAFSNVIQGASGIDARFLKVSPASAVSPIMTKFSQYTPHSTCYLVLVSICWQD
jgi:hypothetical protein